MAGLRRLLTCAALVAGMLLPALSVQVAPASAAAGTLHWGACHNGLGSDYQCATLAVPIDGEEVGNAGPTFPLALARLPATGHRIGSLLLDPGGPGVSGVTELDGLTSMLNSSLLSHFDIVGFDPPGVGASDPVTCLPAAALGRYLALDPSPPTTAGFDGLVASDRSFAKGCLARSGKILPHVSTVAAARDMDRIRQALGEPKLDYLGFSYGTLLGATYAELYPTKVGAMALDGAIDPAVGPVAQIDAQAESLDAQFRQLEASCAHSSSCAWKAVRGKTLAQTFSALLAAVRAHPVKVVGTKQTVGPAELLYGTAAGLYSPDTWGVTEAALAGMDNGDGSTMLELFNAYVGRHANGTYDNTFEAESAVDCLDAPAPSVSQIHADGKSLARKAPVFGLLDLYSEVTCSVWPEKATGQVGPITAPGAPPIVVIGSTGDPITPYRWAVGLAHELRHGVLVTRVGDGHTGYGASSCVQKAVDQYFVDGTVPAAGTRCQSN